jgi:hypothetical protein
MVSLAISALLLGTALGMRFKVLILLPALLVALAGTIGVGSAGGNSLFAIAIAAAIASCCLQLGYVGGAVMRFGLLPDGLVAPRPQSRAAR